MPPIAHPSPVAAIAAVTAAAFYTSIAIGLVTVGAALGVAAFVVWFRNRENLRALDELLREKAQAGLAALEEDPGV